MHTDGSDTKLAVAIERLARRRAVTIANAPSPGFHGTNALGRSVLVRVKITPASVGLRVYMIRVGFGPKALVL